MNRMEEFINFNGDILEKNKFSLELSNRAFRFGDSIFETIRVFNGQVIFIDNHFERLIKSLELVRMSIPEYFTKEYFKSQISNLIKSHKSPNARIRFTIYRKSSSSIYFVDPSNSFDFVIEYSELKENNFSIDLDNYEIDVFEDIKKPSGILSQIKSNNVLLHSIAGSVVNDNVINNIVLVNEKECITEAVNANIFIVKKDRIITPKLSDGCIDGIMRNNVINIIKRQTNYKVEVNSFDKKEFLSCDEVFITNSIIGIQSVSKYKTINYSKSITSSIKNLLIYNINSLKDQQES